MRYSANAVIAFVLCSVTTGRAQAQQIHASIDQQCSRLTADQLADRARTARIRTNLLDQPRVLPGGATMQVTVPVQYMVGHVFCGRLSPGNRPVRVLSAAPGGEGQGGTTVVSLALPNPGLGWYPSSELVLVSFPVDSATGLLALDRPAASLAQEVTLSHKWQVLGGALAVVVLVYLAAVAALGRVDGRHSFNPVRLTAGPRGAASLSQFQIFGFTLLVIGLLTYVLLRTGVLIDISGDLLLLLGISAGGAAGSKVAGVMKKRLSFENWSWLRNRGWLVAYERGESKPDSAPDIRWSDLLKTDGQFDIYSFQLATVSLVVAIALIASDLGELASFDLPDNILALLGLSNAVFIGGKAVAPPSFGELDQKVVQVREAEQAWRTATAEEEAEAAAHTPDAGALQQAKARTAEREAAYLAAAREAARMLKSLFGAEGTKFKGEPIRDEDLL